MEAAATPHPRRSLAASLAKGGLLALISLVLTLGLLEAAVRVLHLGSGGFWEPHPLFGWRNIPGASGWESCYGECAVYVEMNRLGLRDYELGYAAEPGTKRVLFLGDSMTAGLQVPLEATFAKVMQAQLIAGSGSERWESINAAVNGYGTDNALIYYRLEGYKYEPDVVVLGMYLANDVYNNYRSLDLRFGGNSHKPYFTLSEGGELELRNSPVAETDALSVRIGTFLKKHFQLPRFVAESLRLRAQVPEFLKPIVRLFSGERGAQAQEERGVGEEGASTGDVCAETYSEEIMAAWKITGALLGELRREVEATSGQLVVLVIPASAQIAPPEDGADWYCGRPNAELASLLEAQSIHYLDLLEPFQEHMLSGGQPLYFQRDFHMNADGHRLAGELLAEYLFEEGLAQP